MVTKNEAVADILRAGPESEPERGGEGAVGKVPCHPASGQSAQVSLIVSGKRERRPVSMDHSEQGGHGET